MKKSAELSEVEKEKCVKYYETLLEMFTFADAQLNLANAIYEDYDDKNRTKELEIILIESLYSTAVLNICKISDIRGDISLPALCNLLDTPCILNGFRIKKTDDKKRIESKCSDIKKIIESKCSQTGEKEDGEDKYIFEKEDHIDDIEAVEILKIVDSIKTRRDKYIAHRDTIQNPEILRIQIMALLKVNTYIFQKLNKIAMLLDNPCIGGMCGNKVFYQNTEKVLVQYKIVKNQLKKLNTIVKYIINNQLREFYPLILSEEAPTNE